MDAYEKIRAALDSGLQRDLEPAYAALAELERAAAEPAATVLGIVVEWTGEQPVAGTKLYTTPPPPPVVPRMFTAEEMEFGMSLRDHFAGLAMARLIECTSTPAYANTIAIEAYKYADAMIKVRK